MPADSDPQSLTEILDARNWSLGDLARAVPVSPSLVSKWARREVSPSLHFANRVAEILGITTALLEQLTAPLKSQRRRGARPSGRRPEAR